MGISSFEALSNVGEGHGEGLHSRKGILEIQDVGIAVNPAELHHLRKEKQKECLDTPPWARIQVGVVCCAYGACKQWIATGKYATHNYFCWRIFCGLLYFHHLFWNSA